MKVFISYAREDYPTAKQVYDDLTNNGISCWMDKEDLLIGQNWQAEISCAIENCSHFLSLISSNALSRRGFVHKEVKMALDELDKMPNNAVFFLPVRLDDCTPQDERLKYLHWGDLFPNYSHGLDLILRTLKASQKTTNNKPTIKQKSGELKASQKTMNNKPTIKQKPIKHKPGEWIEPLTGMEFVWVEGDCFKMGSPKEEEERRANEGPVHEVCIDGFWMARYSVTVGQFKKFINATSYQTEAEKQGWAYGLGLGKQKGHCWKKTHFQQDDHHPVINISWNDAIALTKWLSEKGNDQFRLPSEAEWEFACRAGTQTPFYFGETISTDQANYNGNYVYGNGKKGIYRKQTTPVGTFPENAFGLYDMHGNVWEWCADSYSEDAYSKHEKNNPIYDEAGASFRVLRGGSWSDYPWDVRSAVRFRVEPSNCNSNVGARLLRK